MERMKEKLIVPAVIANDQKELDAAIGKVKDFTKVVQLDIMDNIFVPNTSLWFDFTLPKTSLQYEAHLMIKDPKEWIELHGKKVDTIIFHYEATTDHEEVISLIKSFGKKVGIAINPSTDVSSLKRLMGSMDHVLILTVEPGFYGSKFIPGALKKVKEIKELDSEISIEIDGGVSVKTIEAIAKAGPDLIVSGSFVMKSKNPEESYKELQKVFLL